ncbi:hypothetical protein A4X13_0g4746 [Tilletia indica]|uniref:Uncharacterized protein n=1 Tax=Tilletia indica TaxID=43049 RepID=A0A177TQ27_9BASI|nr:hypothetical protein A4X13_0g4746 [Tilletia indica]
MRVRTKHCPSSAPLPAAQPGSVCTRCSPHVSYRISQQQLDFLTYGPTLSFSKHSDGLFFGRVPAQAVVNLSRRFHYKEEEMRRD